MNLVLYAKKWDMCMFCSVKCEASHKHIVIVDFLMLVAFKLRELAPIGRYYILLYVPLGIKVLSNLRDRIFEGCGEGATYWGHQQSLDWTGLEKIVSNTDTK